MVQYLFIVKLLISVQSEVVANILVFYMLTERKSLRRLPKGTGIEKFSGITQEYMAWTFYKTDFLYYIYSSEHAHHLPLEIEL